jgi:hypothetical protein
MSTDDDVPQVFRLPPGMTFADLARRELEKQAPTKYLVSPATAYSQGGSPRGELKYNSVETCLGCGGGLVFYSQAGERETRMSSMCEPCFDFTLTAIDDRDNNDNWMAAVRHNHDKKDD